MAVEKSKKQNINVRKRQQTVFIIALLAVPIAYWLLTWIYINGSAIVMAFKDRFGEFTFENFTKVWDLMFISQTSKGLQNGFKNTVLTFIAQEFIGVPISLIVSYFIYKRLAGYKVFRVIFYLPHIISGVVYVFAFKQIVSPLGPINALCEQLGINLPTEGLLFTVKTAMPTIIFYYLWISACGNILFYSAMARVPPDLIEVGRLEGLSLFKEFLYVIMPLIWPIFSTTVILDLCGMLNAGGPVLLFGKDVINKTVAYTLPYWFFAQVNDNGAAGIASGTYGLMSAVGLCLTAVSVPITLTIRHFLEKGATSEF